MAKNKFRYEVNRWIDIGADRFPPSLIEKIQGCEIYKDQILKEHFYNPNNILEELNPEGEKSKLSKEEIKFLDYLNQILTKENAAYFRIT